MATWLVSGTSSSGFSFVSGRKDFHFCEGTDLRGRLLLTKLVSEIRRCSHFSRSEYSGRGVLEPQPGRCAASVRAATGCGSFYLLERPASKGSVRIQRVDFLGFSFRCFFCINESGGLLVKLLLWKDETKNTPSTTSRISRNGRVTESTSGCC